MTEPEQLSFEPPLAHEVATQTDASPMLHLREAPPPVSTEFDDPPAPPSGGQ